MRATERDEQSHPRVRRGSPSSRAPGLPPLLAHAGNRAIASALGEDSTAVNVQRDFAFHVSESPMLEAALLDFSRIESADLEPAEFDRLKNQRQRFMPVLGRFASARKTTLVVGTAPKKVTGDRAVTRLILVTKDGVRLNFDSSDRFATAIETKNVERFEVQVLFNKMALGRNKPNAADQETWNLTHRGAVLQSLTHELTVHAENMLDYVEDYWAFIDKTAQVPQALPSASDEHKAFRDSEVPRYEFMKGRVSGQGTTGKAFDTREVSDKLSAK